jgi:tRNA 5-methylaminomethyl-2-thiouridine biosynthesis bifunctional protein
MRTVAVIGAGLAGAACANAFAHAGFKVTVFEQADRVAAGASGVPLAMFAPSISADDAPHSRLLRCGVHTLLGELQRLTDCGQLTQGVDWAMTGVLERCIRSDKKLPSIWLEPHDPFALQSKELSYRIGGFQQIHHGAAGWVNPAKLIAAWLAHPSIMVKTSAPIDDLADAHLQVADAIVAACGHQTCKLVPNVSAALQPIRGQVEWGQASGSINPINGMGHWIEGAGMWLTGATFQRDECELSPRLKDTQLNFEKLAILRPEISQFRLAQLRETSQSWVGVRAAQKTRLPLHERLNDAGHPNAWICAGLGSRGLSLAALCAAELLGLVQNHLALS